MLGFLPSVFSESIKVPVVPLRSKCILNFSRLCLIAVHHLPAWSAIPSTEQLVLAVQFSCPIMLPEMPTWPRTGTPWSHGSPLPPKLLLPVPHGCFSYSRPSQLCKLRWQTWTLRACKLISDIAIAKVLVLQNSIFSMQCKHWWITWRVRLILCNLGVRIQF